MKNIHILPTDKPSRLVLETVNNNLFLTTTKDFGTKIMQFQNIYITSDEQAKEGDWGYIPFQGGDVKLVGKYFADDWKKIILTTDQSLDGVQPIDDEFLEWFVKNPSCEEVKWSAYPISPNGNIVATNRPYPFEGLISNFKIEYKIIIPKEEREQDYSKIREGLKKSIKGKEHFIQHFKNGGSVEDFKPLEEAKQRAKNYMSLKGALEPKQEKDDSYIKEQKERRRKLFNLIDELEEKKLQEEPKQETLEEFIDKVDTPADFDQFTFDEGIRVGAKWMQEIMYSEEEVLKLLIKFSDDRTFLKKYVAIQWFEQFKKK